MAQGGSDIVYQKELILTGCARDAPLTTMSWSLMLAVKDAKCFVNGLWRAKVSSLRLGGAASNAPDT